MGELVGPFSDGKVVLRISVVLGVFFAAVAWGLVDLLELTVTPALKSSIVIAGFALGFGLVFVGHIAWHYRRSMAGD